MDVSPAASPFRCPRLPLLGGARPPTLEPCEDPVLKQEDGGPEADQHHTTIRWSSYEAPPPLPLPIEVSDCTSVFQNTSEYITDLQVRNVLLCPFL